MTSTGRYLSLDGRRTFVWDDGPDAGSGDPVVGVVICPPLGYPATCAARTLHELAGRLAALGHPVARVEYDGTANAEGDHLDPDRVPAWTRSVVAAVAHLADRGASSVCVVGLGIGATLGASAAAGLPIVRHLVLWDPVLSGRRYGRELAVMAAAAEEDQPVDDPQIALSVVGQRLTHDTIAALKTLDLTKVELGGREVLLVERPERPSAEELQEVWRAQGTAVEQRAIDGTAELLDTDAELAVIPTAIVDAIAAWVHGRAAEPLAGSGQLPAVEVSSTLVTDGFVEEFDRVGPWGLAGVWGRPAGGLGDGCMIFLNNGVSPSIGPARAWVQMSRELNRKGWSTLRLDTSGLGESPTRRGQRDDDTHASVVTTDVSDAIDAALARGHQRVFVGGLCSGAYNALEAQIADPRITASVSINPALWVTPSRRRPWVPPWWRPFGWAMRKAPVRRVVLRLPRGFWRVLSALRITPAGDQSVGRIARAGGASALVFSDGDPGLVDLERRSTIPLERYRAGVGDVHLEVLPAMDHSLFGYGQREQVLAVVIRWLDRFRA